MQLATQDENSIKIDTPLGKDKLYLTRFVFEEAISELFNVKAQVYTNGEDIDSQALIGKDVTITLKLGGGKNRFIHGMVSDVTSLGLRVAKEADDKVHKDYVLTIVPATWFMQHRVNSRIFKKKMFLKL